jgi:hypothetical protein
MLPDFRKSNHSVKLWALHMDQSTAINVKVAAIWSAFRNRDGGAFTPAGLGRLSATHTSTITREPKIAQNKLSL